MTYQPGDEVMLFIRPGQPVGEVRKVGRIYLQVFLPSWDKVVFEEHYFCVKAPGALPPCR